MARVGGCFRRSHPGRATSYKCPAPYYHSNGRQVLLERGKRISNRADYVGSRLSRRLLSRVPYGRRGCLRVCIVSTYRLGRVGASVDQQIRGEPITLCIGALDPSECPTSSRPEEPLIHCVVLTAMASKPQLYALRLLIAVTEGA